MRKRRASAIGTFTVVFVADEDGGYVVYVPSLPGCNTEGDTFEEAKNNAKEAIEGYLLAYKDLEHEMYLQKQPPIVTNITAALPA